MTPSRVFLPMMFVIVAISGLNGRAAMPAGATLLLDSSEFNSVDDARAAGWSMWAQRDEIRPEFSVGRPDSEQQPGYLTISCGSSEIARGGWMKVAVGITPGAFYRLEATCRVSGVPFPALKTLARLVWLDSGGNKVLLPE